MKKCLSEIIDNILFNSIGFLTILIILNVYSKVAECKLSFNSWQSILFMICAFGISGFFRFICEGIKED